MCVCLAINLFLKKKKKEKKETLSMEVCYMTNLINYCILFKSMSAIIQEMESKLPLSHNKFQVQIKASTIFGKIQD